MSIIKCNDGSIINCDDNRHLVWDERGREIDDLDAEPEDDAELARVVADAVCDALRSRRKARDSRKARDESDITERQRHKMFDERPPDHRKDFNTPGENGARDSAMPRSELLDLDAMFAAPVQRRDFNFSPGGAQDSAIAMDRGAQIDLDAMFAAPTRN
jgi:hypothetical protein